MFIYIKNLISINTYYFYIFVNFSLNIDLNLNLFLNLIIKLILIYL